MNELSCDYVLARYVSSPPRDEARNIGVVLRVPEARYVGVRFLDDLTQRLGAEADESDLEILKEYMADFEANAKVAQAATRALFADGDVFAEKYMHGLWEKFSGKLQFTRPRGAITTDPVEELEKLFNFFVTPEKTGRRGAALEKDSLFSGVVAELERRELRPRIGLRYPVKVKKEQLVFSFGYRRARGAKYEVVVETVDMRAETFSQRVRALAPTTVKFEITKMHRPNLEALCLVRLPDLGKPLNGEFSLELETLRRHADGVFDFGNEGQRARFLNKVESDLRR